jgi:lipopolysaccharide/colanic/teichoic acid biosynthesis glycosyltransferase
MFDSWAYSESAVRTSVEVPRTPSRVEPRPRGDRLLRALDVTIAVLAIVFLAPLLIALALLICADGGAPVFAHSRIGRNGRPFPCFKFRSMVRDAEAKLIAILATDERARQEWAKDHKLRDDPRVTRLGGFLRRSSLDELPQLFNVLRGEMSIVGPRPIVEAEIMRYGRRFRSYCTVRPGITGLWQVSGRNDVSYRRRVALDVLYARRRDPMLDMWIILRTIPAVLTRKGCY